jgi:hypothetical protein
MEKTMKSPYKKSASVGKLLYPLVLVMVALLQSGCVMATWAGMLLPALVVIALIAVPALLIFLSMRDRI